MHKLTEHEESGHTGGGHAWNHIHTKYRNAANGICMFVHKYTFIYVCNNNKKENRLNLRVWLGVREFGGRVWGGDLGKRMWCNSILISNTLKWNQ